MPIKKKEWKTYFNDTITNSHYFDGKLYHYSAQKEMNLIIKIKITSERDKQLKETELASINEIM